MRLSHVHVSTKWWDMWLHERASMGGAPYKFAKKGGAPNIHTCVWQHM